jgi:hypothetical protein
LRTRIKIAEQAITIIEMMGAILHSLMALTITSSAVLITGNTDVTVENVAM